MKKQLIIILAAALFGAFNLTSCDKDDDNDDGDNDGGGELEIGELEIGDSYQGGIVFYLDGFGGGLISAPTDYPAEAVWGCSGTPISGADGTAIGTGAQNTIGIEAGCTTSGTAADICTNLTFGGYSDWFLPSKDELNLMWLNIGQGNDLELGNVGGFVSDSYWSSTEEDFTHAWFQYFANGSQNNVTKSGTQLVRAVRAF